MPYTYLIKCRATNQYYYGVRFSKNCNPDELWQTYFTSSKYVKELIEQYGVTGFDFEIRKVFNSVKEARDWEHRVLYRIKAKNRNDFLNKTDNKSINTTNFRWWTNGVKNTRSINCPGEGWYIGSCTIVKRSKESIDKQMKTRVEKYGSYAINKGKSHTAETKNKISKTKTGVKIGPQTNEHIEKRKMFGERNPMFGKKHTVEVIEKLRISNSVPKSEDHKQKISIALKSYYQNK